MKIGMTSIALRATWPAKVSAKILSMEGGSVMRSSLLLTLSLALVPALVPSLSFAKEVRYKDYSLEIKDGDRLVLIGLKGTVRMAPATGLTGGVMRVRKAVGEKASAADLAAFEATSFNVRREGNQLIIEQKSTDPRLVFDAAAVKGHPELDYEILAPMVPTEVAVRDAQVQIRDWKQSLALEIVAGSVTTTATEGPLRIQIQRGEVHVNQHKGRLAIDSYTAKVAVHEVEGDVELQNFNGETSMSDVIGSLDVRGQGGAISITKSSGAIDFLTGHNSLTLSGFQGPVRGSVDQGTVNVSLEGEVEVRIESNQGAVNVKLPADSGASVRLQSEDGSLTAPDSIKAVGRSKILSGHLKGEGPKGSVAMKSKSGALHVHL